MLCRQIHVKSNLVQYTKIQFIIYYDMKHPDKIFEAFLSTNQRLVALFPTKLQIIRQMSTFFNSSLNPNPKFYKLWRSSTPRATFVCIPLGKKRKEKNG